jgi:hypothetical protein
MIPAHTAEALELERRLSDFLKSEEERLGGPQPAVKPPHRVPFEWPRSSLSARYHIPHSAYVGHATLSVDGQEFPVEVAETEYGVFGRCERFWAEARGANVEAMLANLQAECMPLWRRQRAIGKALGRDERVETPVSAMEPLDLCRLLYCEDRDVANEAMTVIDEAASRGIWGPALLTILRDRSHPLRRQAQWCVLDLLEDLRGFFPSEAEQAEALRVLEEFLWGCEDDYARTCYKCGDVLGDHVADDRAVDLLLRVLAGAPSPFGRRSAIHGLIHATEWLSERKDEILAALERASHDDAHPLLREYAAIAMDDIRVGAPGFHPHGPEPVFEGE